MRQAAFSAGFVWERGRPLFGGSLGFFNLGDHHRRAGRNLQSKHRPQRVYRPSDDCVQREHVATARHELYDFTSFGESGWDQHCAGHGKCQHSGSVGVWTMTRGLSYDSWEAHGRAIYPVVDGPDYSDDRRAASPSACVRGSRNRDIALCVLGVMSWRKRRVANPAAEWHPFGGRTYLPSPQGPGA